LLVHLGGALYLAGATQFAEAIADYVVLELDFWETIQRKS